MRDKEVWSLFSVHIYNCLFSRKYYIMERKRSKCRLCIEFSRNWGLFRGLVSERFDNIVIKHRETILDIQALSCQILKSSINENHEQFDISYSLSPEPSQDSTGSVLLGLPEVTKENLDDIKLRITACFSPQRDVFASLILQEDGQYLRQLLSLSQECEFSGDLESCGKIAEIIKGIVFLNSSAIIDFIIEVNLFLNMSQQSLG